MKVVSDSSLPAALSAHSAWTSFHRSLCAPPAARIQPSRPRAPQPPPPVDALDASITQAEVEKALPKLSNGKSAGNVGWPAELLRHAAYHVQLEDGRRVKFWMLTPILTAFLNACFVQGRLPACVSSALMTPIHKKGAVTDTANYRPIAVGEPLYRLYTIILNASLVAWSEEHGLRNPTQAGFRLGHSPIHHLFALRHFTDRAILQRGLCGVCGFAKGL